MFVVGLDTELHILAQSVMDSPHQIQLLRLLFFIFILVAPLSTWAFISDAVGGNGRSLLQIKKPCPVNIENQNYTIITSQCKGPDYPSDPCCSAFKELACPFADQLNDLSNDCSERLLSYISTVGQYPPGLFASICREGKDGLPCPVPPPPPPASNAALRPPMLVALLLLPLHLVVWKLSL